jgi:adenylosuccinate synthase
VYLFFCSKCKEFSDLPETAKEFVRFVENHLKIPITWIGVGPGREEIIKKKGFI